MADEADWERRYRESLNAEQQRIEIEDGITTGRYRAESPDRFVYAQLGVVWGLGLLGVGAVAAFATRSTLGVMALGQRGLYAVAR